MDPRQPHYPRPADRPLLQNPNHQPVSQPPSRPYSTTSQPTFQIPAHDPFQRRAPDPFLPQPQTQRRGSYGLINSGRDGLPPSRVDRPPLSAPWTGSASSTPLHHSAGPSPTLQHPATIGPPAGPPYAHERPGVGGGQFSAGPNEHHPPPPPPSGFLSRQMPPPSPSQQSAQASPYGAPRGPPPPPTFSSGRELPGLGSTPRHGAGMSISSILGDTTTTSQAPSYSHHASPAGNSRSPSSGPQRPLSPHRRGHSQSIVSKLDTPWRRERTPDRHSHLPAGLRAQEGGAYSTNSSPAHFAPRGSPEFARAGPALFQQPYQASAPPRPFHGSPNEGQRREPPRLEERVPPRPNSQPAGLAPPPNGQTLQREPIPPFGSRPPFATYPPPDRREDQRLPVTSMHEQPMMSRERPPTGEPSTHSYSPSRAHERPKEIASRETGRRDDFSTPFRTGFRNQYYQPRGAIAPPEAPRSHPQSTNPFEGPRDGPQLHQMPQERATHHGDPQDRRTSEPHALNPDAHYQRLLRDDTPLAMQRSRSSLGLEGKRRASPLPQAVQGAQMQPTGAGSDPSIKSEFGRIFQGLGSGLGGSITPSRQSPMPQRNPPGADLDAVAVGEHEAGRPGSTSKKHRRVKEEGAGPEEDGRGTQNAPGSRGSKRAKAGHHHHIHLQPHHHHVHAHVHRPDDAGGVASAHHHHHIHTDHHHHHAAAGSRNAPQPTVVELPEPKLTVHSQAVIDSVKDRVRKHLGNELYEPKNSLPPGAMTSNADDKFGYFLRYVPSRSFTEKDFNCTYTVRIPRHMLTAEIRENICRNRNLFGTDVYTDDSDPIATLIHSGWLRGAWAEDTDVALLNLPSSPADDPGTELLSAPPAAPQTPPDDMDLHVTMLILPALKRYAGCIRNGISSREWGIGAQHDGVSWMPVGMQWLDESCSRAQRRGGQARRQRLRDQQVEAAMALMGLSGGLGAGIEHARVLAGAA